MTASSDIPPLATNSAATSSSRATRTVAVTGNEINSRDLFCSDRELVIVHGGDRYRLRLTSQNKLILTK